MEAESVRPPAQQSPVAGRPDLHVETTCSTCGRPVKKVRDLRRPDVWVALDGRDPEGSWWSARDTVSGHWRVVRPMPGEEPPATAVRYREHSCTDVERVERDLAGVFAVAAALPVVADDPSMGWCAGNCGARTRAYGPNAEILCADCRGVLEVWRALPGPHRGSVPFGKLVDGVYQHRKT